ncbi:hypothetical protein CEY16_14210 [Halalkalibacillus sediminis]|uniref:Uncharacterized protein n=1 Tax=Halalkalibacillus sediminis TaxID=2018042 RepID=A0A2I0QRJ4_9BACI|nr:hypothetical protein [Halalkalibacillus sediminis]PKR76956.1 hypothetical protein CEY16_14210 [Halalkalibacillus sediminis]
MKNRMLFFVIASSILIILAFIAISGGFTSIGSIGNPSASDILGGNPDADIIRFDDLIYSQRDELYGRSIEDIEKGEKVGEIKKQTTTSWWFWDLYATKLSEGTPVFFEDGETSETPSILIVELEGEELIYSALIEG